MEEFDFIKKETLSYEVMIVSVNRTGEEGYDIYIRNDGLNILWSTILEIGKELDINL